MLLLLESECIARMEGFAVRGNVSTLPALKKHLLSPRCGYDIVLLNPFLPFDALSQALDALRSRGGAVIVVSRCSRSAFIATAYLYGAFDYILAPFDPYRLQASLLECRRYIRRLASLPASATQRQIDALLERRKAVAAPASFGSPPKTPDHHRLVETMRILSEAETPLSLAEVVRKSSMSRSSVWRCLRHLEANGFIGSRQEYKGVGRPSIHFFPLELSKTFPRVFLETNEQK